MMIFAAYFLLASRARIQAGAGSAQAQVSLESAAAPPPAPKGTDVIGTVNGKPIYASDAEPYLWAWLGNEAANELAELKAVKMAAQADGVTASKSEILSRLKSDLENADSEKKANKADPAPNESAVQYLADQGFPLTRLYLRSEISVLADKMAEKKFDPAQFVEVDTAVFRAKDQSAASIANAADRAGNAYKSLKLGIKWDDILKATGANSKILESGGRLGWRNVSIFPEMIQKSLTTLKPGSYTEPVQTQYGFQIFKIEAQGSKATAAEIADLKKLYIPYASEQILKQIHSSAKIVIKLKEE